MKKTLLLTTCVLISTSVWAFGGVGIFGHKSHHSSGVSSIGVHYNGKDDKPNIDIRSCDSETEELVGSECCKKTLIYTDNDTTKCCSTEGYAVQDGKCKKQCGEGLVLNKETNECCSEELGHCCPIGQIPHDLPYPPFKSCCNGELYCTPRNNDGSCPGGYSFCCPQGKKVLSIAPEEYGALISEHCCPAGSTEIAPSGECCGYDNTFVLDGWCCPAGSTSVSLSDGCCEAGTTAIPDKKYEETHCCPLGSTGYSTSTWECCTSGMVEIYAPDYDMDSHCCPEGSTSFDYDLQECI